MRERKALIPTIAVLAAAYLVAGKLGLQLAFVNASATAVWPPTGIGLAAVLLVNPRCHTCRTGPMYHPQHKFGPCWVVLPSGDQCGCTAGKPAPAD